MVVDPANHFLYHVQKGGQAIRYGVGVGGEEFGWSGVATVRDKREWPDWYPTKEILQRKPEIRSALVDLHGGLGMPGGPENPLGARALYLGREARTLSTGFTARTSRGPSARAFRRGAFV